MENNGKLERLLSEMRREARAYNKYLTEDYLKSLSPRILASLTEPDSRIEYLERLKYIEKEQAERAIAREEGPGKWYPGEFPASAQPAV
jgi:hypothetical protein